MNPRVNRGLRYNYSAGLGLIIGAPEAMATPLQASSPTSGGVPEAVVPGTAVGVRVVSHRVVFPQEKSVTPFALYCIRTEEAGCVWHIERRWSELRSLYYQLWNEWSPQLSRCTIIPKPPFRHHSYKVGKLRLDHLLLQHREKQMEALLRFFVSALMLRLDGAPPMLRDFLIEDAAQPAVSLATSSSVASVASAVSASVMGGRGVLPRGSLPAGVRAIDPPYQGKPTLTIAELQAACDAPTPADAWFTPGRGWPETLAWHSRRGREVCCQSLTAPVVDTAAAAPPTVGCLRVEVLEASGLPNLDTFSLTDACVLMAKPWALPYTAKPLALSYMAKPWALSCMPVTCLYYARARGSILHACARTQVRGRALRGHRRPYMHHR